MTRRLPNCAGCGMPLSKAKARMVSTFGAVRGVPMIGTCWDTDPANPGKCMDTVPTLHGPGKVPLATVLRMIAARGPGRVSLTHKPSLGREVTLDEACASADELEGKP